VLLSSVFLFTNLTSLVYFLRLIDLVATANRDTVIALGAHPWSLNPFAFLGQAEATRWRDSIGYPAMIVIWWVGFIALTSIRAGGTKCQFLGVGVVLGIFVVVGLCAEFSMYDVLAALSERAPDLDVGSISDNVWSFPPGTMWSLHNCATWAGIVLSVAVFLALALFHPHLLPYLSRAIRLSKYTPPGRGSKPDSCCSVL
jgi:hypothetical protein